MKKSFTLLELIFVVIIVIILSSVLLNTVFFQSIDNSNIAKIKSEVFLIRTVINQNYHQKIVSKQENIYIDVLDMSPNNKEKHYLFIGTKTEPLLQEIILSSAINLKKDARWIKTAKYTYLVVIKGVSVVFTYNKNTGNFSCNYDKKLCKELSE